MLDRSPPSGILDPPLSSSAPPFTGVHPDGPARHRNDQHPQDYGSGMVFTHIHVPVKGTNVHPTPPPPKFSRNHEIESSPRSATSERPAFGRLPKLNFADFDGSNPKLWISRTENYFDMYSVPSEMWIRVAGHYCKGPAARWLQSVERHCHHGVE